MATCNAPNLAEQNLTVTAAAPENCASENAASEKTVFEKGAHLPLCGNCETSLLGPFCHMCGQAVRSPVREFFSFVFDSVGEFMRPDGKFFRSLAALYFRPGMLTTRYLEGQRVNFIKPVRLYFSLSVILFLLISFEMSLKTQLRPAIHKNGQNLTIGFDAPKADEKTPVSPVKVAAADTPPAAQHATIVKPEVDTQSRNDGKSGSSGQSKSSGQPSDNGQAKKNDQFIDFEVGGKPWDAITNPFVLNWLPTFANNWLNNKLSHLNEVGDEAEKHPEKVVESLFQVLPTMMFLLLPVFALVLKGLYFFRKRLYAEHLLVAVQSHSFLFLSFIVLVLLNDIGELSGPKIAKFTTPLSVSVLIWMPIYLFLMQKRVYRQGWFWTTFKYGVGGFTYSMLLSIGLLFAMVAALVNM